MSGSSSSSEPSSDAKSSSMRRSGVKSGASSSSSSWSRCLSERRLELAAIGGGGGGLLRRAGGGGAFADPGVLTGLLAAPMSKSTAHTRMTSLQTLTGSRASSTQIHVGLHVAHLCPWPVALHEIHKPHFNFVRWAAPDCLREPAESMRGQQAGQPLQ